MSALLQSPNVTSVRSWAAAALLLDRGIEPVGATVNGPVVSFDFPAAEANAVLARYSILIGRLNVVADAARATKAAQ